MAGNGNQTTSLMCEALHPTERQRQVIALIAGHLTTAEAAVVLGLSANTVKKHIDAAMAVAGVHRRRDLIDLVRRQNLLDMTATPPRWTGCGCPIGR